MANLNAPSGLSPVSYINGAPWNGQCRLYRVAAASTTALYVGDPVKIDATNYAGADGIPAVVQAAAGNVCRGVAVAIGLAVPNSYAGGPYVNPNDLSKISRPSGAQATDYYVAVCDDPMVVYEIQESTDSTPGQAAQMSKNANFVVAAPATGIYLSGVQLNSNAYAVTATHNLKVLGAVQRGDNTPYTAYQKLLVLLNSHDFHTGVAGV